MLFYGVWNIAKIPTARVKSLVDFDPFPADALVEYRQRADRGQRSLRSWQQRWSDQLHYLARGYPDPGAGLTAAFNENRYLRSVRGAYACDILKNIVGQDEFSRIVDQYERTRTSSGKAVAVDQFQQLTEAVYGQSLQWFFGPWMDETQLPQFKLDQVSLIRNGEGWRVSGHLLQTSKLFYRLPIELALHTEQGMESRTLWQDERDTPFELHTPKKPLRLVVDPNEVVLKIQRVPPRLHWLRAPDSTNVVVIYGTVAETEANKAVAERLKKTYMLPSASSVIKADTDATTDDLKADCLVLLGRPAVNTIAERLQDRFPIKFDGARFTWQGKVYDLATQGVIAVVDEGRSSKRLTMLFAGLSAEATRNIRAIDKLYALFTKASYLIFDGNKCVVSGEWDPADPDLVWQF